MTVFRSLALVIFLSASTAALAATSHVQSNDSDNTGATAATSITTKVFGASTTTGSTIAAAMSWAGTTANLDSCTDTAGNTYTVAYSGIRDTTNSQSGGACYAMNITGGSSFTVTGNFSASVGFRGAVAHEIGGAAVSSFQCQASNQQINPGTGTDAVTSTTCNFTGAGNYVFGASFQDSGSGNTPTAGTNFTARESANACGGDLCWLSESRIESGTGNFAATVTNVGASDDNITILMAFAPAVTAIAGCRLLQDGTSFRLLQDGTSKRLLQAGAGAGCAGGGPAPTYPGWYGQTGWYN